jgi:hypothetical protein
MLPLVLYRCENWALTLREEYRIRLVDNGAEEGAWAWKGGSNRRLNNISH